jgi:glycosyltransferase involved in cell wall biosynthesis
MNKNLSKEPQSKSQSFNVDSALLIDVTGEQSGATGFATAHRRHVQALSAFNSVRAYGSRENAQIVYAHGSARLFNNVPQGQHNIGYLVCETDKLSVVMRKAAERFDEIWTCSTFCAEVLTSTHKPVKLVPHYAETFGFNKTENTRPVFLVAFNAHSRALRKNPVLAVKAINAAAPGSLVIVKSLNMEMWMQRWLQREASDVTIEFVMEELETLALKALYQRVDILVSLHASEGFGLHLLEAMALGKTVVASRWGGNVDFMSDNNSFLVDCVEGAVNDDYFLGAWGYPVFESAVEAVKKAVDVCDKVGFNFQVSESVQGYSLPATVYKTQLALHGN